MCIRDRITRKLKPVLLAQVLVKKVFGFKIAWCPGGPVLQTGSSEAVYKMYMFDFRPFTFLTLSDTPSPTLEANHSNGGVQVKGVTSKATGWLWADGTSGGTVILTNVSGTFSAGEKLTASDSAETDSILENSSNADITLTRAITKNVSQVRQLHMTDVDV